MQEALTLTAYETVPELAAALERDGFVYMPGVVDADEIAELRRRMDALDLDPAAFDWRTTYDKHIKVIFNRDPYFLPLIDREPVVSVAEAVMGEDCHIIGETSWTTGPSRPDQRLHIDYLALEVPEHLLVSGEVRVPIYIATAHFYLNDLYEELGPTKFIPGSHLAGRKPKEGDVGWNDRQEQSLLCRAGDVVMFRSDVWHRGSANTSGEMRYLIQVHYAQRMITQKFPPYLKFQFNEATLEAANPRQLRLLGGHKPSNYG